jgi:hypothetical protein
MSSGNIPAISVMNHSVKRKIKNVPALMSVHQDENVVPVVPPNFSTPTSADVRRADIKDALIRV